MVPLFAAIDVLHEGFRYRDLDLITNRNSLRKLLRYVDNDRGLKDFRIDIDLVRYTCLFTRCEENAAIVGCWSGYGNEYLKAATRAPRTCENMTDHHRIITYVSHAHTWNYHEVVQLITLAELWGSKGFVGFHGGCLH